VQLLDLRDRVLCPPRPPARPPAAKSECGAPFAVSARAMAARVLGVLTPGYFHPPSPTAGRLDPAALVLRHSLRCALLAPRGAVLLRPRHERRDHAERRRRARCALCATGLPRYTLAVDGVVGRGCVHAPLDLALTFTAPTPSTTAAPPPTGGRARATRREPAGGL
jgi:hypothetical protein